MGIGLAIAVGSPVMVLAILSALSRRPDTLGVHDGRLSPCPETPNCVSSTATDEPHRVEPLELRGNPDEALDRLAAVVESFPRARIVERSKTYIHAEFKSALFRFVDDVEFLVNENEERIDVRSASRVGRSDLGVNRRRVEEIRKRLRH